MQRPYMNSMCALGLLTLLVTGCGSLDPTDTVEDSDTGDDTDRADVYSPDNGPTHVAGRVISVASEEDVLASIASATPGDVITLAPGSYSFDQMIRVQQDGTQDDRIFFRADTAGTVTVYLSHLVNFKIFGKYWVFENIRFEGDCENGSGCEHAFQNCG